jgi:hypothetical protein
MQDCFLTELLETGRVRASAVGGTVEAMMTQLPTAIHDADIAARLELPATPPALSIPAATWAATLFYHACRFLVYREFGEAVIRSNLQSKCPESPSPSSCYSVDLTLRYLPDLIRQASGIADDDPLVKSLMQIARQWPLSSVGIPLEGEVDASRFIKDRCLRTMYAERILTQGDVTRLKSSEVRQVVREVIGIHAERWPTITAALKEKKD